jgi:hypothetical protein
VRKTTALGVGDSAAAEAAKAAANALVDAARRADRDQPSTRRGKAPVAFRPWLMT